MSAALALCPFVAVRSAVCDELGLIEDEVFLECSLVDDYGAHGEELVDILRAVERSTGLLLDPGGLRRRLRGSLALVTIGDLVELVTAAAARRH